jgi:enoyl-CoA hydratase
LTFHEFYLKYNNMDYTRLLIEQKGAVAILTLNRPEVHNAMDTETWVELRHAIRSINADNGINVLVITGAGGKAFAAGGDLHELLNRSVVEQAYIQSGAIFNEIYNMNNPVIAAIEGYALGGGCELALSCDIRIAGRQSKFGQTETGLGIIPGAGATQRLQRMLGIGMAKYLIFTGDIISAEEAERIGLIEKIAEPGKALEEALKLADKIAKKAPIALAMAKTAINFGANTDLGSGLYFEKFAQAIALSSNDRTEGISAFLEKRQPEFKGK